MNRIAGLMTAVAPTGRDYGALKGMVALWDLSGEPENNNDRDEKLGFGDLTNAVAFSDYDADAKSAQLADGLLNEPGVMTRRHFDPDTWVLRLFTENGLGRDAAWHPRLVAEHEHPASGRTHRSMMVVDSCDAQHFGWLSDVMWVKNIATPVFDKELKFDKSGFLRDSIVQLLGQTEGATPGKTVVTGGGVAATSSITRGAVMYNMARNNGFITDGKIAGQLSHVLHLGTPAVGTGTVAIIRRLLECGQVSKEQLSVRGDVNFHFGTLLAGFAMNLIAAPENGDLIAGRFFIGAASPIGPAEVATDPNTNHEQIPRALGSGIRPYVRMPRDYSMFGGSGIPESFIDSPTPTGDTGTKRPPKPLSQNGFNKMVMKAGDLTMIYRTMALPLKSADVDVIMHVPFVLSGAISLADEIKFSLFYRVFANPGDTISGSWIEIPATIVPTDLPSGYGFGSDTPLFLTFLIKDIGIETDIGGGQVAFWFCRRSDDVQADPRDFIVVGDIKPSVRPTGADQSDPVDEAILIA